MNVTISTILPAFLEFDDLPLWVFIVAGVVLLAAIYYFRYGLLVRLPIWLLTHTLYRIKVYGLENLPEKGPFLLVSNHVSHIDAGLILAATKRPVRFLVWAPYMRLPGLRWLLQFGKVIPIRGTAGPRAIIEALRTAGEALAKGDIVCIFAEGGITRTGFLLPFQRGFEHIVKHTPVPIVPVCLDHVWGSVFSFQGRRFFWKRPKRIPYTAYVNFGTPLPATATPFEVRQAIQHLSAESAIRRSCERPLVHRQFVRRAVRHPLRSCIVDTTNQKKPVLKYGETLAGAKILLKLLRPVLGDDPIIGVWLPPSGGAALTNIVLAFLGKTVVNLNYTATATVVQSAIRQCGITKVITSKLFCLKVELDAGPGVDVIYLEDFRKKVSTWMRIKAIASVLFFPGFIQERWILGLGKHKPDDLLTIIFSSGSTGEPKGIMLTHRNIAANAESMIQAIDPGPKDRLLGILPFFHSFGFSVTLWVPLEVGASVLYHPNPLQAREIGEYCHKYQCTIFLSTPTFLRSFIKRCEPGDFASLRLLMCGAEKLPPAVAKEFKAKFGVEALEGYGCTELSPAAAANVPNFQQGSVRQIGNKPGTIGLPLPGVAARIVDKDTLQPLGPNQEGLLLIHGANIMKGYLGKDDATKQKIIDGWYVTGDLGFLDEDGFITITGRVERFAKVGGEMVPLEKIEDEIQSILKTSDRMCAVTSVPDAKKGERIVVLYLSSDGFDVQKIWQQLLERGLPTIYIPGPKDFFAVTEIPVLGSGKLDLTKCKQKALEVTGNGQS